MLLGPTITYHVLDPLKNAFNRFLKLPNIGLPMPKIAIITGASSGIGKGLAERYSHATIPLLLDEKLNYWHFNLPCQQRPDWGLWCILKDTIFSCIQDILELRVMYWLLMLASSNLRRLKCQCRCPWIHHFINTGCWHSAMRLFQPWSSNNPGIAVISSLPAIAAYPEAGPTVQVKLQWMRYLTCAWP